MCVLTQDLEHQTSSATEDVREHRPAAGTSPPPSAPAPGLIFARSGRGSAAT
ncbi:hypothetical protein [Streptosporangium sp. NPDC048865]|uniref:hypothetical protein n=1 Tax=Streptosporangium sp. NPDC048865 TaxID=3155766 RepID=UPI0034135B5A